MSVLNLRMEQEAADDPVFVQLAGRLFEAHELEQIELSIKERIACATHRVVVTVVSTPRT